MVIINDGGGKGKTTSAIGQAIRAAGQGLRVKIVQMVKNGDSGELKAIRKMQSVLPIDFEQVGAGFTSQGDKQTHIEAAKVGIKVAETSIDNYDMIIVDEINYAVSGGLIDESDVLNLIKSANDKGVHLVLTGRGATDKMKDAADIVTEMEKIKHAYDSGVKAQIGIEF